MSRHRGRLTRLQRTSRSTPPTPEAVAAAQSRALGRVFARLRREAGSELSETDEILLADQGQAAIDSQTIRRSVRAQGIDPDRDHAERIERLRRRLLTD